MQSKTELDVRGQDAPQRSAPYGVSVWQHGLLACVLLAIEFWLGLAGTNLPDPVPATDTSGRFSALRAAGLLSKVLGDGSPHPMGSVANAAVRDRISILLESWGYQPELQQEWGGKFRLPQSENIVARLDGRAPDSAVLVTCHYDSADAAPGAGDDGIGVSIVLGLARMLKSGPPLKNSIVFLFSDGEEQGFFGSLAFARRHRWGGDFKAVVNLDGGASNGPFYLHDTGFENAWLAPVFAKSVPHPLVAALAGLRPRARFHRTDFSVYRDRGWQGFDLGVAKSHDTYHTPLDDFSHISLGTLQHGGDTALALVRALAGADLQHPEPGHVVMMDLFGRWTLRWPVWLNFALLFTVVASWIAIVVTLRQTGNLKARWLKRSIGGWVLMLAVAALAGRLLQFTALDLSPAGIAATWIAVALLSFACFHSVAARANPWEVWTAVSGGWLACSLALFIFSPALGHLLLLPLLPAGAAVFFGRTKLDNSWALFAAAMTPPIIAVLLLAYLLKAATSAEGEGFFLFTLVSLVILSGLLCFMPRNNRKLSIGLGILGSILLIIAVSGGANRIKHCNLRYVLNTSTGRAEWQAGLTNPEFGRPSMFHSVKFSKDRMQARPWDQGAFAASADASSIMPPQLQILYSSHGQGEYRIRVRFIPAHPSSTGMLLFPPQAHLKAIEAKGQPLTPTKWQNGCQGTSVATVPPDGVELVLQLSPESSVSVDAAEYFSGLPPGGERLQQERNRFALPFSMGDTTMVVKTIPLMVESSRDSK